MTNTMPTLFLASLFAFALQALPAEALNARSFISANGSDANLCTRAAPCRTLQKAHDSTITSGEINMLDPAGYGTVTITKAISIVNDGVGSAGVLVPANSTGVTINAGAGDAINLRGLIIEGTNSANTVGIRFNTGMSLTIENCVIRGNAGDGIDFWPQASSALAVANSLTASNGSHGIAVAPSGSGAVTAILDRVAMLNNGILGLFVNGSNSTGTLNVTVSESAAAGNFDGFEVYAPAGQAVSQLMLSRAVAANNSNNGIVAAGALATLRLGQSVVSRNTVGWFTFLGGSVLSYGTNQIDHNGSFQAAPPAAALK